MSRVRSGSPLRLAVLISGGGTTLHNLLEKQKKESLPIDIRCVLSSKTSAAGLRFANDSKIPTHVVTRSTFDTAEAYRDAIFGICREANVDYVVMAGFLKHVLIPDDFENRVLNIHPSLIPAFCGQGLYGLHVHQAALAAGVDASGCTVHFVDNEYDHGPIILQKRVPIAANDTPESLAARVFESECEAYPEVLRLLADDRIRVQDHEVTVA